MNFNKKIFVLGIFVFFICMFGAYHIYDFQNNDAISVISNETDDSGCCSVIWQQEGNSSILSYRRDANLTADITIEEIDLNGLQAIKQSKTEGGYFTHVIVTSNGWIIGLGGIDDGEDNKYCEEIASSMINEDNSISEQALSEIQNIKKQYKKGHAIIKAPNGNYGFATDDKIKTGTLKPGQYISMPNKYKYSRAGDLSLGTKDKIKAAVELVQSDVFGINRRGVFVYSFNSNDTGNFTDIYVSNDDGAQFDTNFPEKIDNVYFNNTLTKAEDIPIGPNYKHIGSLSFLKETPKFSKLTLLLFIVGFVVVVGVLFFIVLRFVRSVRYRFRRRKY